MDAVPPVTTIRTRATGAAGALGLMLAVATPFIGTNEGLRTRPYRDTVGVLTVCYGETRVAMREYTVEFCRARLQQAIATEYAPKVLACAPPLGGLPVTWAAHTDLAYNIGVSAYCKSTAARLTKARRFVDGCNAFMMWKRPPEILKRRTRARDLCLKGLTA